MVRSETCCGVNITLSSPNFKVFLSLNEHAKFDAHFPIYGNPVAYSQ